MHLGERRTLSFQHRIGCLLLIAGQALARLLIGGLPFFQQVVIEPTALLKGLVELARLLLGGVDTVLKHLSHRSSVAHFYVDANGLLKPTPSRPRRGTRLISPCIHAGALRRGLVKMIS